MHPKPTGIAKRRLVEVASTAQILIAAVLGARASCHRDCVEDTTIPSPSERHVSFEFALNMNVQRDADAEERVETHGEQTEGARKIEAKLSAHPLTQQKEAKREEIEIARGDLQNIVDELARAQALLQSKIDAKNQVTAELKQEAANLVGGDDTEDDEDDGEDD